MLQYTSVENLLTAAPDDYSAQPVNVRSYTFAEIIRRMLARNPGLSEAQLTSAINEFVEEVSIITAEGDSVNTPLINTSLSIQGVLNSAADTFDAKRHRVRINVNAGMKLAAAVAGVKPQKTDVAEPLPHIIEVKDIVSGSVNETLTAGGVVQIRGSRLKFIPEEDSNGIFLTDANGATIKLTVVVENKPARLMAMLPADLPQGEYTVEVRSNYSASGKSSQTLKTGKFHKIITA
ncbi:MAG: DUF4469 domain-containing protein [Bacteroidales bacterium]|jgi:hypothetical protein|nr:DUF4469 domain-containing protein [Bacteroidales bacterium]